MLINIIPSGSKFTRSLAFNLNLIISNRENKGGGDRAENPIKKL